MAMVTLYLHSIYLHKRLGILIILIWIVYALPFLHIPPYILFDFNSSPTTLWGLAVNPYMLDEEVISLTAMIGAVGGCGIACGASLNRKRMQRDLGVDSNGDARLFLTINFSSSELTDLWVEVITNSTTIINEFLYLNFINQAPIF